MLETTFVALFARDDDDSLELAVLSPVWSRCEPLLAASSDVMIGVVVSMFGIPGGVPAATSGEPMAFISTAIIVFPDGFPCGLLRTALMALLAAACAASSAKSSGVDDWRLI